MTVLAESTSTLLAKAFGRVSRALRYRTRAAHEELGVTDSESELLRLLRRQPGIRVQDAASELGIASNSVSTLVKQLTRLRRIRGEFHLPGARPGLTSAWPSVNGGNDPRGEGDEDLRLCGCQRGRWRGGGRSGLLAGKGECVLNL